MTPIRIRILNPKAIDLIKGMEELDLIEIEKDPSSKVREYLKRMRKHTVKAPSQKEIGEIVDKIRSKRYAEK